MPLYAQLLDHQFKRRWRRLRSRHFWLVAIFGGLFVLYVVFSLIVLGITAGALIRVELPGTSPSAYVNRHLLHALVVLFPLRFFLQRSPLLDLRPYLVQPIPRGVLARFFTLVSHLSAHNLFPLLFLVPFAFVSVRHEHGAGALVWLLGIAGVLSVCDLLNTLLRAVAGHRTGAFLLIFLGLLGLMGLDSWFGGSTAQRLSGGFFGALAGGSLPLLGMIALACGGLFLYTTRYLEQHILDGPRGTRRFVELLRFDAGGPVASLVRLEFALILRNKRPRQFMIVASFFSTLYTAIYLTGSFTGTAIGNGIVAFMASGMFALNYGPLMFGWESAYFDGHLARPLSLRDVVASKLWVLQLSCLLLALLALPFFVWLAPELLHLHGAFMLYNAGISTVAMTSLALRGRQRLTLDRSSFFNYEGFSIKQLGWTIPVILPPLLVLLALGPDASGPHDPTATYLIGGAGLLSLLLTPMWCYLLAARLTHARHAMAFSFRQHGD